MAVTFTGAGTAVAASGASPQAVTTATDFAVGDILVALIAYDNSGGGGADPMSGTISVAPATGAVGASVSAQTGHNDPGAASAGLAARCVCFPVTTAIPTSTVINVSWSGTVVVRAVVFVKVSSTAVTGYRTNSGTGGNSIAVTTVSHVSIATVNNGEGILYWAGYENGVALTGDADTTNGTWGSIYGTFTGTGVAGMAAYMQGKVVTATATQTWDPTGNATATDWITGYLIFTETPVPAITQAAYRIYDDGTESGAVALAAQDTAVNGDVLFGDGIGQLRVRLQSTNAGILNATDDYQLQWEKNASGTWTNVGSPVLADSYAETNSTNVTGLSSAGAVRAQSFLGNGSTLQSVRFWGHKQGTGGSDTLVATLYAHTGTFGSTGTGTGAALATSAAVAGTAMGGTGAALAWTEFTFDGTFTLTAGTPYVIGIGRTGATDATNYFFVGRDDSSPTHAGNGSQLNSGAWTLFAVDMVFELYTSATTVVGYASPSTTDGGASTNRLGAGTGSFVAGKTSEDGLVDNLGWSSNNYTELLYSLKVVKADVVVGDVIRFRVLRNGSTTGMTYTVTPTINVVESTITQAAYRFYADGTETGSTALAAQDTAPTVDVSSGDANAQVRMRLQSTGGASIPATDDFQLQWEKNTSGSWTSLSTVPVEILSDTYDETNVSTTSGLVSIVYSIGQSFLGDGRDLTKVGFWLTHVGSPPFNLTCQLWAHTGTFGVDGTGTGTALATATPIAASTVPTTATWVEFPIPATHLDDGVPYVVTIGNSVAGSTGNQIDVGGAQPGAAPGNACSRSSGGAWSLSSVERIYRIYTTGPLNDVVAPYASTNLTDAAATTNRLGAGSGSFVAGKVSEDGLADDVGWSVGNYTELLFSITLKQADFANGDTLKFRVLRNGVTTGTTYTQVPTATIALSVGPTDHPGTITSSWGTWTASADGTVTTPPARTESAWSSPPATATTFAPAAIAATIATNWSSLTEKLYPNSVQNFSGITASSGAVIDSWQLVDESPDSLDSESVAHNGASAGNYRVRLTDAVAIPAIQTVRARVAWSRAGYASGTARLLVKLIEFSGIDVTDQVVISQDVNGGPTVTEITFTLNATGISQATSPPDFNAWYARFDLDANVGTTTTLHAIEVNYGGAAGWVATSAAAVTKSATITSSWGTWTATSLATVTHPATIASSWGTWTATSIATRSITTTVTENWGGWVATAAGVTTRYATITTPWGTWTGTAAGTVTVGAVEYTGTIASNWGTWTGTALAQAIQRNATITSPWGTWTATGIAITNRPATIATPWGTWTGTALAQPIQRNATITTPWGTWSGTALAQAVQRNATITSPWGTWTATGIATRSITTTVTENWGGWVATATASRFTTGTITTPWGTWTATAAGTVIAEEIFASVTSSWGTWTATGIAVVNRPATIATPWGNWTATALAQPLTRNASITSPWGTWTATALAQPIQRNATVASDWGTWSATSTALLTHPAAIDTNWGNWTGIALGTQLGQVAATIISDWGTWTGTATALLDRKATISTDWGTWFGTAVAVPVHPATIKTVWMGVSFLDNFNRPDLAAPGLGAGWAAPGYELLSNMAKRSGGGDFARSLTDIGSLDHSVSVDIVGTPGVQNDDYNMVAARCDAGLSSNCVLGYIDPGGGHAPQIACFQGGSFFILAGSGSYDISGTYTLRLECIGNTANLYHNGTLAATTNISSLTNLGTYGGLNANSAAPPFDNFLVSLVSTWTGTAVAQPLTHPATITTSWGTWTATSTATRSITTTVTENWGGWVGTATGVVRTAGTISTAWGTWIATASGTRVTTATIASTWGGWTATAVGGQTHPASVTSVWGGWTATAIAQPLTHPATIATNWGTWTGTAIGTTAGVAVGSIASNWGTWTATAQGTVIAEVISGTISSDWGTWTAIAVGIRTTPATIASSWGTWTATATALLDRKATITTPWGTWTGTATGISGAGVSATITTNWGGWAATAQGTVIAEVVPGAVTTSWGTWTATATATRRHFVSISTTWGGWTATANAIGEGEATITSDWGTWTATASAITGHPATVTTSWGVWTATGNALITNPADITSTWGLWIGVAWGTVTKPALVSTTWGGGWTGIAYGWTHPPVTILNEALEIFLGDKPVEAVYVGSIQVWPDT